MRHSSKPRTIYIVDDNEQFRESLSLFFCRLGYNTRTFAAAEKFLLSIDEIVRPCVVLVDMRMSLMSGLEMLGWLKTKGYKFPVIFVSGQSEPEEIIRSLKGGAGDFLLKPVPLDVLTASVGHAFAAELKCLDAEEKADILKKRVRALTPREVLVARLIIHGFGNKEIAAKLNIKADTAKKYRSNIYAKLNAKSLSDLIKHGAAQLDKILDSL